MGGESPKPAKKELLKPLIYGGVTTVDIRTVDGKLNEPDRGSQTALHKGIVDRLRHRRSVEEKLFDKKGNLSGFETKTRIINGDVGTEVALVAEPDLVNGGPDYKKPVLEKISKFGAPSLLVDEFELFEYLKDGEERVRRLKMRTKRDGANFVTEKNFVGVDGKVFPEDIVEKSLKGALLSTRHTEYLTEKKSDGGTKLVLGDDDRPIEESSEVVKYGEYGKDELPNLMRPKVVGRITEKVEGFTEKYKQPTKISKTEISNIGSDSERTVTITLTEMEYTGKGGRSDLRHVTEVVEEYGDTDSDQPDQKKKIGRRVSSSSYAEMSAGVGLIKQLLQSYTYAPKERRESSEESEYIWREEFGVLEQRVDKIDGRPVRRNRYYYNADVLPLPYGNEVASAVIVGYSEKILVSEDLVNGVSYRCIPTSEEEKKQIERYPKKQAELREILGRNEDVADWKIVGEPIKKDPEKYLRSGVTGV